MDSSIHSFNPMNIITSIKQPFKDAAKVGEKVDVSKPDIKVEVEAFEAASKKKNTSFNRNVGLTVGLAALAVVTLALIPVLPAVLVGMVVIGCAAAAIGLCCKMAMDRKEMATELKYINAYMKLDDNSRREIRSKGLGNLSELQESAKNILILEGEEKLLQSIQDCIGGIRQQKGKSSAEGDDYYVGQLKSSLRNALPPEANFQQFDSIEQFYMGLLLAEKKG